MRTGLAASALAGVLLSSTSVRADPERSVSLTLSPIHLLFPVVEGQVEIALGDSVSLAAIGGFGEITVEDASGHEEFTGSVMELGGQFVYYPLERFESLQVGAEVLYVRIEADDPDGRVTGLGRGLAAGPFIGYKLLTSGGFTFFVQGGVEYLAIQADTQSGGAQASDEESRWIPLLNLNLGWSF